MGLSYLLLSRHYIGGIHSIKKPCSYYHNSSLLCIWKDEGESYEFLNGVWFNLVNNEMYFSKMVSLNGERSKRSLKVPGKYHGLSKEWVYLIIGIEFLIYIDIII
jgi:hypothetical protein